MPGYLPSSKSLLIDIPITRKQIAQADHNHMGLEVDGAVELRKACKVRAGQRVQTGDALIEVLAAPPKAV
jgi:hypothetical protein